MMARPASRPQPGLLFIAACIAALALRLLLPAGWMPVATGDGPRLSLCSGVAPAADPAAPAPDSAAPCDFALATGPLLLAAALVLPLPALALLPAPVRRLRPARLHPHWPRPPGHGPPAA